MKAFVLICLLISSSLKASEFLPKSFSFDFEQVYKMSSSKKEKKNSGHVDYMYPGHIRFKVISPDQVEFVTNSQKTWYYTAPFIDGEPGELTERPRSKQMFLVNFFDQLKYGLNDNQNYKVEKINEGRKLLFTKKAKEELGMIMAEIYFDGNKEDFNHIKKVILTYPDNNSTKQGVLTLSQVKTDLKFTTEHFVFKAPKNTIIGH